MTEFFSSLFNGAIGSWSGGVAHSVLILAAVIAIGVALAKIRIWNISLGSTWIMFAGIVFGHFGMTLDEHLLHFLKEFGLIMFVYSIGQQVGPGFFSAFRKGGVTLNMLAIGCIALSVIVTLVLFYLTGTPITTMTGIMSGAVTNTPGLGAAQQAYSDMYGTDAPEIAMGYAVAYPLGVVGAILALLVVKYMTATFPLKAGNGNEKDERADLSVIPISIEICNEAIDRKRIMDVQPLVNRRFVISRVLHHDGNNTVELVNGDTVLRLHDKILIIAAPVDIEAIVVFFGHRIEMDWEAEGKEFISRRILITKSKLQGKTLSQLNLRKNMAVSITRINRSGVDLVATPNLQLQIGDRVTVVGSKLNIEHVEKLLGNSMKRLDHPNLLPIFIGIALGCILGSIPFSIPGIPQPVKLGLAGGPLIISILVSRFGPKYKLVTYSTMSANLMIREIGISLFLACVGLGAGKDFVSTIVDQGGLVWIAYGAAITVIPLLIIGIIGHFACKINYQTLIGVMAGSTTNPPALAYATEQGNSDAVSVSYATVYPLSMFLRVLAAQVMILCMA